jgi:Fe2+ or Zn2+ uptake regulation protein
MSGRFFVRLDVLPHPVDGRRSAKHYHVLCNKCGSTLETVVSLEPHENDSRHAEAHMIAESLEYCEACGSGMTTPIVAEADLVSAQM